METTKKVVIDCKPEELNEILEKDFLDINGVIYFKRSRVQEFCEKFVKHLEKNGKIQILSSEKKTETPNDSADAP